MYRSANVVLTISEDDKLHILEKSGAINMESRKLKKAYGTEDTKPHVRLIYCTLLLLM